MVTMVSAGRAQKEMRRWPGHLRKTRAECPGPREGPFYNTPGLARPAKAAERSKKWAAPKGNLEVVDGSSARAATSRSQS